MSIEMNDESMRCSRCRTLYSKRKGNFVKSYAPLYKGVGYIHVCKECISAMYNLYLKQCGDMGQAVRQICRKFDLYWNETVFDYVEKKSTPQNVVFQYLARISTNSSYSGKCYDDTLIAEGKLWNFIDAEEDNDETDEEEQEQCNEVDTTPEEGEDLSDIDEEVVMFWGSGYTPAMYRELEDRRKYWMSRLPGSDELDIGSEAFIRQICALELDINKSRVLGKPVDKQIGALNALLGSMNMKPTQRKNDDIENDINSTPMGVWLYRYENKRPLPDIDEQLKDVNGVKKYVFTWMGHLCKMMGIKNGYTKMYEEEIERLRVTKPEYDGDEEDLIIESYSDVHGDE